MASGSGQQSPWWLECLQCSRRVVNACDLRLAQVGLDGFHMALRPELEPRVDTIIEKKQHPKPERRKEAPFKMYCHGATCSNDLGVYQLLEERFFYVFSSKSVRFRSERGDEKKIKRWKQSKADLEAMGVQVLKVNAAWQNMSRNADEKRTEKPPKEMVYCNMEKTTDEQINELVLDTPREYQKELFRQTMKGNSIVYLPTGSGKTLVASMVIGAMKKLNPDKMIAFLVHRIPLVYQQSQYIKKQIPRMRVEILAGDLARFPGDREHWEHVIMGIAQKRIDVLVITAQIFFNFLVDENPTLKLSDVSCIVFDEAHNCRGNHVFAQIMRNFYSPLAARYKPLVLGLTASPAGAMTIDETREQLTALLATLQAHCVMPILSNDLALHWNHPMTSYVLRPLDTTQEALERVLVEFLEGLRPKIEQLSRMNETLTKIPGYSHHFKSCLRTIIDRCHSHREYLEGLALAQYAMNIFAVVELNRVLGPSHAYEALEAMVKSIDSVRSPMDMVTRRLLLAHPTYETFRQQITQFAHITKVASGRFTELLTIARKFLEQVKQDGTSRAIVFVHMRRTCFKLCEELCKDDVIKEQLNPMACVGHGSGFDGMQWKGEQEVVITRFHEGKCKLLISTNVLEEGLDVPACNLVIRYDSRGTCLRALVQSRGRAARRSDSRFVIMCNSEEEKSKYEDLAMKERNIEQAVRENVKVSTNTISQASRFGCQTSCLSRETSGAEKRKAPNEDGPKMPNKKRPAKPRPRPSTAVTLHVTQSLSPNITEATEFLEQHFDIKSFRPQRTQSDSLVKIEKLNTMQKAHLEIMEVTDDQKANKEKSRQEIFQEIAKEWCQSSPRGMWLEKGGPKRPSRGTSVHALHVQAVAMGDFKDRTAFVEDWVYQCQPGGAMVIFEHDLQETTLAFQDESGGSVYKIEFPYKEIQDCLLVDTARPGSGAVSLFVPLRSAPRVYQATEFYGNDTSADDDDDEELRNIFDQEDMLSDSDDDDSEIDDAGSEEDENPDNQEIGNDSSVELSNQMIGKLKLVKKWKRLSQIRSQRLRILTFGNSLVLKIVLWFNDAVWDTLRAMGYYDQRVCYASINVTRKSPGTWTTDQALPAKILHAFECLTSRHPAVTQRISGTFFQKLRQGGVEKSVDALDRIAILLDENHFVDPETTLDCLSQNYKSLGRRKVIVPENCALIPRIVFTPSRQIYFPPEVMQKNRVLRHFREHKFICLQVRDEDFSRLASHTGDIQDILERLKQLLSTQISVGGVKYEFLGCSNSQMRSHSCWFVAPGPSGDADSIREWMGDFSKISCVATFMARMGQCFSTSTDTIAIIPEETGIEFEDIDDVTMEADDQTYTFSDGVGRISLNVVKKVSSFIDKSVPPSALQIRFAGYKGVLTTDLQIEDNRIQLRPSMRKFSSNHRQLEVLQASRPQVVYLNHQIIMLLSNLGVPDKVFIGHQQIMLDKLAYMMTDEDEANQRLSSSIRTGINYQALVNAGVSLTTEPYFKSLLCALYKEKIFGLLSKARIQLPVSEARLMMGVMDETGSLRPGQVFVQYTGLRSDDDEDSSEVVVKNRKTIVTGRVAVTRNPCLHPGDVRQLEAVDRPALRHLVDCVVFPRYGPRPHPNEMAGGDLDGDLYFVCWGKDLLPTKPDFAAMNYKSPGKKTVDGPITLDHMTDFITEYITHDQLGVIDNTHKAQADDQQTGIESPICLELAELHSLAVDAPKTGLWQQVPAKARLREYPDFMMKTDKPSYPSQKVLGKLYQECRNFQESMTFKSPQHAGNVDARFLTQGFRDYVEDARDTLVEYTEHIETVMNLYGIQSEEELMSGCFYKLQKKLGREKQQIADVVRQVLRELRTSFRQKFFREFDRDHTPLVSSQVTSEMQKKASAWYYVSYQSESNPPGRATDPERHLKRVIGFPWIVDDVLATIPPRDREFSKHVPSRTAAYLTTGKSLVDLFMTQSENIMESYTERLQVKSTLLQVIHSSNFRDLGLVVFGSSANLSFEKNSDIDMCVLRSNQIQSNKKLEKKDQLSLLRKLEPVLREIYSGVHLVSNARIPIFRLAGLKSTLGSRLCVDLCANPDGFLKAMLITSYIHEHPALLPLLRMIIQWARDSGLIRKSEGSLINTNLLVFMVLTFCVRAGWVAELGVEDIRDHAQRVVKNRIKDAEMIAKWQTTLTQISGNTPTSEDNEEMEVSTEQEETHNLYLGPRNTPIGFVLLEFFRGHKSLLDATPLPTCFARLLEVTTFQCLLGEGDAQLLHEQMQRAYHILALHSDVTVLLEVCAAKIQRSCYLNDQLSAWIAGSEAYHSKMFSDKSGAKVRIRPRLPGRGASLLLEASGTSVALRHLETILNDKSATLVAQPLSAIGLCFVGGANTMIFEGSEADTEPVSLVPYYGRHHFTHDHLVLHVPLLGNPKASIGVIDPRERSFLIFRDKFLQQVDVIAQEYNAVIHGKTLQFNVHFGRLYTLHVPRSLTEDTDPITVKSLQVSLKQGFETKAASLMSLGSPMKGPKLSRRPFNQRKRFKKTKPDTRSPEKKSRKTQSPPKHSFFTSLPDHALPKLVEFLWTKGFREDPSKGEPYILVTASTEEGVECDVTYDDDVRPTAIRSPKLRWFVADVKRLWQQRSTDADQEFEPDMLNGVECDFRLMIRSFEHFPPNAVGDIPQKKYVDILRPRPPGASNINTCPFQINLDMKSNLNLVRQHVSQRVFVPKQGGVDGGSIAISLDEVVEYSRVKLNGSFASVFKRHEVTMMPTLPDIWSSRETMEKFAWDTWSLAYEMAKELWQ